MSNLAEFKRLLGKAADDLPDLSELSDDEVATLVQLLLDARRKQSQEIQDAVDQSLGLLPRVLRPAVKKLIQ